jgi:trimeric autotransporter adhesin
MRRVGTFGAVFCLAFAAVSIDTTGALATTNVISTVAGTGVAGYSGDGGQAAAAQLATPAGVTVDGAGNVYVADDSDNVVRKIQPSGVITTVAGTGVAGYSGNGQAATAAQLRGPTDVVRDTAGNLYIADDGNHVVRKVTPSGTISTVAGNGSAGYAGDGSLATKAKLTAPVGLDVDTAGNLYIADYGNGTVRKVSSAGIITTVAGKGIVGFSGDGGAATAAELSHPGDVVAVGGELYIADGGNSRVRAVSAAGTISTVAGNGTFAATGDGGPATSASLMFPTGLAADSAGDLFISDFYGNTIRKVAGDGTISTVAGTGVAGSSC